MEHIALPQYPVHPPLEVPYICTKEYDGKSFMEYPKREGWEKVLSIPGELYEEMSSKIWNRFSAFLQNWFFFGLLRCFLEEPITSKDFTRTLQHPFRKVICTTDLNDRLAKFIEREEKLHIQYRALNFKNRQHYLDTVNQVFHDLRQFNNWVAWPLNMILQYLGHLESRTSFSKRGFSKMDGVQGRFQCF